MPSFETLAVFYEIMAAQAQHDADMAHEVACPCGCHGAASGEDGHAGRMIDAEPYLCSLCAFTGRVTLGRIVERDRAMKRSTKHGDQG